MTFDSLTEAMECKPFVARNARVAVVGVSSTPESHCAVLVLVGGTTDGIIIARGGAQDKSKPTM